LKAPRLTQCQADWVNKLQEYNFEIHHILGKSNAKADYLSRWAGHEKGDKDNEDAMVLPPTLFKQMAQKTQGKEEEIVEEIKP
jgi:hypothetical protein